MQRFATLALGLAMLAAPPALAQQACQAPGASRAVVQTVQWRAQDGKADEVAGILQRLGALSRAEPGVAAFIIHRSPTEPNEFFLYEQYRDQAGLQAHLDSAHFKDLVLARALPLLAQRVRSITALQPCP